MDLRQSHLSSLVVLLVTLTHCAVSGSISHDCPDEHSACHNFQCCKPDEYCGINSFECEPCFSQEATADDNFQTCMEIKNTSDIAIKLRHASCVGACLYTFGAKLYEGLSKSVKRMVENCSVDGQLGSSNVKIPGAEVAAVQVASSDDGTTGFPVYGVGILTAIGGVIIGASMMWCKMRYDRQRSMSNKAKDKDSDVEKGPEEAPFDQKLENSMAKVRKSESVKQNECDAFNPSEATSLIHDLPQGRSTGEDCAYPGQPGIMPGTTVSDISAQEYIQMQSIQPEFVQMEREQPNQTSSTEPPQPGVQQANGAARSNGRILNPILCETTNDGTTEIVCE